MNGQNIPGTDIPKPKVKLVGEDGNAFLILGKVKRALQLAGVSTEIIEEYLEQARSGNYDHLLMVTMNYVDVS